MPSQVKKRKLVAVGPSGSSSVKKQKRHAEHSPDAQLLTRIVKKTEQPILQQTLLSSIATASPSDLDSLKRILGPLVTAAQNPLHCVRCHKSYLEQENTWVSCKIRHLEAWDTDSEPSSDDYDYESDSDGGYDSSGHWKGSMMKFPCCGERYREDDEDKMMREPCVSSKHTTDPNQVEYYAGPVELPPKQKNGPIDFGRWYKRYKGQNENVITCQQAGCASKR